MKPRTAGETAILCATGLIAFGLVIIAFHQVTMDTGSNKPLIWLAVVAVAALGMVLSYRYLTTRKRAQLEVTSGEQYRRLADEYRRLADLAITAQEHTDLKLGDVGVQLDYLREKIESLQKILEDVE